MIHAFTGIKNKVDWTLIALYIFWGSALVKIMQKIAGHSIFEAQIETFEAKKSSFFSNGHVCTSKILSKIGTHLIFCSSEK